MSLPPILMYPGRGRPRTPAVPAPTIAFVGSPNFFPGWGGHQPIAIVVHTMAGSLGATDHIFNDPTVQPDLRVSAHYGVGLDGTVHQYIALDDRAWANGILEPGNTWFGPPGVNPNYLTVSIETEDLGDGATPVSDAQYSAVLGVCRLVCATFPSITSLTSHHVISPLSREHCCGSRWTAPPPGRTQGRLYDLADATGLTRRF